MRNLIVIFALFSLALSACNKKESKRPGGDVRSKKDPIKSSSIATLRFEDGEEKILKLFIPALDSVFSGSLNSSQILNWAEEDGNRTIKVLSLSNGNRILAFYDSEEMATNTFLFVWNKAEEEFKLSWEKPVSRMEAAQVAEELRYRGRLNVSTAVDIGNDIVDYAIDKEVTLKEATDVILNEREIDIDFEIKVIGANLPSLYNESNEESPDSSTASGDTRIIIHGDESQSGQHTQGQLPVTHSTSGHSATANQEPPLPLPPGYGGGPHVQPNLDVIHVEYTEPTYHYDDGTSSVGNGSNSEKPKRGNSHWTGGEKYWEADCDPHHRNGKCDANDI